MSSENRVERKALDSYQTPPELADFLVAKLVADDYLIDEPLALEPSAGDGAFVRAMAKHLNPGRLVANEIDLEDGRRGEIYKSVSAEIYDYPFERIIEKNWSAIVGNPPFSQAEEHVRHALKLANPQGGVVAFLLRLAFLESRRRISLWKEFPLRQLYVLSERPSFTGGLTDNSAYGFFVWVRGDPSRSEFEVVSWKPPRPKRERPIDPKTLPIWPDD